MNPKEQLTNPPFFHFFSARLTADDAPPPLTRLFTYSFPTFLSNARLPIPLISIYTRPTFFVVPVSNDMECAASAPYLKDYCVSNSPSGGQSGK